jgi:small subunit ribosomal protein S16
MVKLRLKRFGKKHQPSYRIIAIDSRARREGRPLEELGYYNPRTKETVLETAGLLKWLRRGAKPTDTVDSLLRKAGIYEMLKAGEGAWWPRFAFRPSPNLKPGRSRRFPRDQSRGRRSPSPRQPLRPRLSYACG